MRGSRAMNSAAEWCGAHALNVKQGPGLSYTKVRRQHRPQPDLLMLDDPLFNNPKGKHQDMEDFSVRTVFHFTFEQRRNNRRFHQLDIVFHNPDRYTTINQDFLKDSIYEGLETLREYKEVRGNLSESCFSLKQEKVLKSTNRFATDSLPVTGDVLMFNPKWFWQNRFPIQSWPLASTSSTFLMICVLSWGGYSSSSTGFLSHSSFWPPDPENIRGVPTLLQKKDKIPNLESLPRGC
ncbi:hypothetical protein VNO77_23349 [Canavalia gladiata]|uniref:Uncharacterized protein n=1 Tax=Canavalia gladiata TaxID=3824 RepID=A0AAN9L7N8_CANGL